MTIEVSTTEKRDGKALALFARHETWQTGHTKDGRSFFAIPGAAAGLFHMADQRDCSCPDRQRARNICKHMRAVRFWMAAFQASAVSPKREASATGQDDRILLTAKGAAALVGLDYERDDVVESPSKHPQVVRLQAMLVRERCPDSWQAIAAKVDDTQARIVATAKRRPAYGELMDRHLVEA